MVQNKVIRIKDDVPTRGKKHLNNYYGGNKHRD